MNGEEKGESGASGGVDNTESEGMEPTMSDLMLLFWAHMGQQEAREARQEENNIRQEQRFRALQHQFQLLQMEVQARTSPVPESLPAKLEPLDPEPPELDITPQVGDGKSTGNQSHVSLTIMSLNWKSLQIMMTSCLNALH